jgi:hypothetical protein
LPFFLRFGIAEYFEVLPLKKKFCMLRVAILFLLFFCFSKCGVPTQNQGNKNNKKDTSRSMNFRKNTLKLTDSQQYNKAVINLNASSATYKKLSLKQKFMGLWSIYGTPDSDFYTNGEYLEIHRYITYFVITELGVECKNVYHKDTLWLYIVGLDSKPGFWATKYSPPKTKSLFAKCYLVDSGLGIYYTQKQFRNNMKDLELSSVLYKIETPGTQIDE